MTPLTEDRFILTGIIEPAEVVELRKVRERLRELDARADAYTAAHPKFLFEQARNRHHSNPTEKTLAALEEVALSPQEFANADFRNRELRRAAQKLVLKYFREHAKKLLLTVFERAVAALRSEAEDQRQREQIVAEYYGVTFAPSEVSRVLDQRARHVEEKRRFLENEAQWSRSMPDLDTLLLGVGVSLDAPAGA